MDVTICDDEFLALIVQDVLLSGDESLLSYAAHACEAFQDRSKYEVLSQLIHAMSEQQPFTQSEQIIAKWLTQKQSQKNYMEWGILFAQLYELHVLELDETAFQHWRTLMTRLEETRSLQDIDWLNEDMTRLLYVMQADCYYQYGRYLKTNSSSEFQKALNRCLRSTSRCVCRVIGMFKYYHNVAMPAYTCLRKERIRCVFTYWNNQSSISKQLYQSTAMILRQLKV